MGSVLGKPVEPKIDWDEEGEDSDGLAGCEVKPLPGPLEDTTEGVEIIEEMDTSWVKLISSSLTVVVPNKVPTIERISNGAVDPELHRLEELEWAHEHTQEMSQISSDDGVRCLKRGDPHSLRTVAEAVSSASRLIDVKLL